MPQDRPDLWDVVDGFRAQAEAAGLEVGHGEDAYEEQDRRDDRDPHDLDIRDVRELDHEECGSAHDRRRDLPARRRDGLHACGKVPCVAGLAHGGNREGPGRHDVSGRRAGQHPHKSRGHDGRLRGPTRQPPGERPCDFGEKAASSGRQKECAQKDEKKDVVGRHRDRHVPYPVGRHVGLLDDSFDAETTIIERLGQVISKKRKDDEEQRQPHQNPTDRAPSRLEQDQQQR